MTEEEREQLNLVSKQTKEIHDALFKKPIGSKFNLIERIVAVVNAVEKGSWAFRGILIGIPTLGGIIIGWDRIVAFFKGGT